MATKSKTVAKKPAAKKPVTAHKAAPSNTTKVAPRKAEPVHHHKPAAKPAAAAAPAPAPAKPAPKPIRRDVESVSLIDKPAPKKAADGESKKKTTLPPISRIGASL